LGDSYSAATNSGVINQLPEIQKKDKETTDKRQINQAIDTPCANPA
jgi:hypothetical protein